MADTLQPLVDTGVTHAVFGDIFLEDLRQWRETELSKQALTGQTGADGRFPALASRFVNPAGGVLGDRVCYHRGER